MMKARNEPTFFNLVGITWQNAKVLAYEEPQIMATLDGSPFLASPTNGEPFGYLSGSQSPVDNTIHIITSRNHYQFNYEWLIQM